MDGPLTGVRVLEFGNYVAGPYCGSILADMGADVVKVEPPQGGDGLRAWGPQVGEPGAVFPGVNGGKRSVALDLRRPEGRAAAHRLVAGADGLVENLRPGAMARLGLGYADLAAEHPGLIYCSISGFGQSGPYAGRGGFDPVIQAMSGVMSVTGYPGQPPVKVGVPIADFGAGVYGALGFLLAYLQRQRTGRGRQVDVAMLDVCLAWTALLAGPLAAAGEVPGRLGSGHPFSAPYQALRAADGYVVIAAGNQELWERLCRELGAETLSADPRYASNAERKRRDAELAAELEPYLARDTVAAWVARLSAAGVPCGPVNDLQQALDDPQVRQRGMWRLAPHQSLGQLGRLGFPIQFSDLPPPPATPAACLGEDTAAILREAGLSAAEVAELVAAGAIPAAAAR